MYIIHFFVNGGFFMILLLLFSFLAFTVIFLRSMVLRDHTVFPRPLIQEIHRFKRGHSLEQITEKIINHHSPLASIVNTLLSHLSASRLENAEAVQTRARYEMARLENGLVLLEITTGVAPLLGLLGTLSGLVGIFANIGDPVAVARGISEALNTTIMGLAVAAPSLIAHHYFMRKIEMIAVEMESLTTELLSKCYASSDKSPTLPA